MRFARLVVVVECIDKHASVRLQIFFLGSFSHQLNIICYANNTMLTRKFSVDPVAVGLEDSDMTGCCLILKLSFLDQGSNNITDCAALGHEDFKYLLRRG